MELLFDNLICEESFLNFNPVSQSVKHTIIELLQDASQFNTNDVLVNLDHGSVVSFYVGADRDLHLHKQNDLQLQSNQQNNLKLQSNQQNDQPLNPTIKAILSSAKKTEKEQGIFPLCITQGYIEWEFKQTAVRSPLLLFPCQIEISKVKDSVKILPIEDAFFINPFLVNRLKKEFDILIPEEINSAEDLTDFLIKKDFKHVDATPQFLGNFHHHRFEIIKELEELKEQEYSSALSNLLGDETVQSNSHLNLSSELLFPTDTDQLEVFSAFEENHTIVQGPPGTGKSQVLANLLGKLLRKSNSAIVVSEKRVALEVLQKKLQQFGLGDLCFIATSETMSKDVLASLKESWKELEQSDFKTPKTNLRLSEQYVDQLQQQLDLLNKEQLIGGLSFSAFMNFLENRKLEEIVFSSDLPEMNEWIACKEIVQKIYQEKLAELIGRISTGLIQQDFFKKLDQSIKQNLADLDKLTTHFEIETLLDLQKAMKKAALCQNFNSDTFRKHAAILTPDSKEQKRFLKLRKKYLQLHFVQSNFDLEKVHWKKFPSQIETEILLDQVKNDSLFGKWKLKKMWSKYSSVPLNKAEEILHKWKQDLVNLDSISQIKVELCEIGIDDVAIELESLYQQIHYYTSEDRAEWLKIPTYQRNVFAEYNGMLNQIYSQLKTNFRLEDTINLRLFLHSVLNEFSTLVQLHDAIKNIPELIHRNFKLHADFNSFELAVCKSNWVKFTSQFPAFSNFKAEDLLDKCHVIIKSREEESLFLAQTIRSIQLERFRYYHQLLQTSSAKLKGTEKELRSRLKRGKAILVKEFSKTRNHPSLRELFASEAQEWLRLFKPVWLSNPTQIAKCFPMQQGLFDVAIFDEASQIPLQNALGTVQRANHILIAGDQQQMGPSSYFKASSGEVVDLLHQASFYWKNVSLKHHYRSEHPALIQFSNKHFYNNELMAYPSVQQEKEPISWHYCSDGQFDERKNHVEANQVAAFIESHIDDKNHLGIVAFSELQLAEIFTCLKPSIQEKLEKRIDEDTAFFKALENVQGEECDHLIISFGYGMNEDGEFHMRFGPLNSKNGSKRLNVLLTRARKKIDFFTSVKASDFKISSNEAVNLWRLFLLQLENQQEKPSVVQFPLELHPQIDGNKVKFERIYTSIKQADELVTLVQIMENRGWRVDFG